MAVNQEEKNPFPMASSASVDAETDLREQPGSGLSLKPTQKVHRNRVWDKEHPTYGYRIPKYVNDELKKIARRKHIVLYELARFFLEYAIDQYKNGEVKIEPKLRSSRLTLYPNENAREDD